MASEAMRAGDSDRQAVADQLKSALDEGRLDLGEYDERLQKTYAAKTYADLEGLLDDLPGTIPARQSQVQPAQQAAAVPVAKVPVTHRVANWVGPYGGVVAVCIIIWAISSVSSHHLQYFWPVWMLIPLVLGVFGHSRGNSGGPGRDRQRRRDR